MVYIKIINDKIHHFPEGMIISIEGGVWFEEDMSVSTPDGSISVESYRIATHDEVESYLRIDNATSSTF
jgi:secreted PhoX family phosphatase